MPMSIAERNPLALWERVGERVCSLALWERVGERACSLALWERVGERAFTNADRKTLP
jgi:hypothetical protein